MSSAGRLPEFLKPHRWDSRIRVLFLGVAVAMFGLLELVSEVVEGDTFAIDKAILRGLRLAGDPSVPIGPDWLRTAMIDLTVLGCVGVRTLVAVFAIGYLVVARKTAATGFAAASITGGATLSALIKALRTRSRPRSPRTFSMCRHRAFRVDIRGTQRSSISHWPPCRCEAKIDERYRPI